jgi:leader peptidase (prepilin peptidase)/N-methyltransferase
LIGGISGFIIFFLIELFGNKIFKKPVLGGGDIKLLSGIGAYLGVQSLFKIVFFSSVAGTLYVLILSVIKKKKLFGEYIQFAPFISIGCLIYVFLL